MRRLTRGGLLLFGVFVAASICSSSCHGSRNGSKACSTCSATCDGGSCKPNRTCSGCSADCGTCSGSGTGGTGSGGAVDSGGTVGSDSSTSGGGSFGTGSVLEHHGSPTRAGAYVAPNLTHAAAARLHVDSSFTATYSGAMYAQPLFVDGGATGRDMVFVATEQNQVSAFDASTGQTIWQRTLGVPMPRGQLPCGNIDPLGITGTPIIDSGSRTIFVDAMLDESDVAHHRVFALNIDDGTTRPGWPVDADASFHSSGVDFTSSLQNERGALALLDGTLYVPYGGFYGDCGSYHGWIAAIPVDNPGIPSAWATSAEKAGIWAPGGLSSDGTSLYGATGNGVSSSWADNDMVGRFGGTDIFSGQTTDYWVPTNWQDLDFYDTDLSGTTPIPLDLPGATPSKLLAVFGKDGNVYLVDRQNMGGIGAAVPTLRASSTEIINASAVYQTAMGTYLVFRGTGSGTCAGTSSNLVAVKVTPGSPPTMSVSWCANAGNGLGSPIATTTDGTSEAVVWVVGAEGDNRLYGFDGDTGATIYGGNDEMTSTRRFITPIVAKGRIFVAADNQLYAFKTN